MKNLSAARRERDYAPSTGALMCYRETTSTGPSVKRDLLKQGVQKMLACAALMQQRNELDPARALYRAAVEKVSAHSLDKQWLFSSTDRKPAPLHTKTPLQWSLHVGDVPSLIILAGGSNHAMRCAHTAHRLDLVPLLVREGACIDAVVEHPRRTLLLARASVGDAAGVALALNLGARVEQRDDEARGAIELVLQSGAADTCAVLDVLRAHGLRMASEFTDADRWVGAALEGASQTALRRVLAEVQPLSLACRNLLDTRAAAHRGFSSAETHALEVMLEHGLDPNTCTNYGTRAPLLGWAASAGNLRLAKTLVACGAEIDKRSQIASGGRWTPLMRAAASQHNRMYDFLLQQGADAQLKDACGWTAETMIHMLNPVVRSREHSTI